MSFARTNDVLHHNVAILFSESSRANYIREAQERGAIYTFQDAWGNTKHWLKGEYAYLAVNAASAMLHRFNIKHDILHEGEGLSPDALLPYHTLLIPNAGYLAEPTILALHEWLRRPETRLIVTGKTNLPNEMLGLARRVPFMPAGYTGWRWTPASPFSDLQAWEPFYITSYAGYTANKVQAKSNSLVLAELYEFSGNLKDSTTADKKLIGDAIVLTDKTLYIANQFLEFFGGMLQAHINIEEIKYWYNPTHWGDTLAYFFERILKQFQPAAWNIRLRSFGTYEGVLSLRHDTDASSDLTLLQAEVENLVPATYHVLDYVISADSTTKEQSEMWVQETAKYNFIETSLHNDCTSYQWVVGKKLAEHVDQSEKRLGITLYTMGRHSGFHQHPETLDAMDYLFEMKPEMRGLCTFCYYNMLEYGRAVPELSEKTPTTYITDGSITIAGPGFWWPYHAVITSVESYKVLRGWDLTHEYDARYELVDILYRSHHSKMPRRPKVAEPAAPPWEQSATAPTWEKWDSRAENFDRLENGVYTIQYHPLFARDPQLNQGRGSLSWMLYAISLAERFNFWLANKKMLYDRMNDYQDIRFRVVAENCIELFNPTDRRIEGLMVESSRPVCRVTDGTSEYIHIVGGRFFTVPPLEAKHSITLKLSEQGSLYPIIRQANHKGLQILDAHYNSAAQTISLELMLIREQFLLVENVGAKKLFRIVENECKTETRIEQSDHKGCLTLSLKGPRDNFVRRVVSITSI